MRPDVRAWHIVTGEYPPDLGGVSAFSRHVAEGLSAAGREVHVWSPARPSGGGRRSGVQVHRVAHGWEPRALRRWDAALERTSGPRELFVQWVPHAFGVHSLNVPFCWWLRGRAERGDRVAVMVHEPFLPHAWSAKREAAAIVHRLMIALVLARASRVWVSIPAWTPLIRGYVRSGVPIDWLPVGSSIAVERDAAAAAVVRARYAAPGQLLLGHFGTYGEEARDLIGRIVPAIAARCGAIRVLLMGRGADLFGAALVRRVPALQGLVHGVGVLDDAALSHHLQACDLLLQPYTDGASARRTTLMAALAHGLAVVTTRGALSEPLWSETDAVTTVPAGDIEAIVAETCRLLGHPDARAGLAAAASRLYGDKFDVARAVARLLGQPGTAPA